MAYDPDERVVVKVRPGHTHGRYRQHKPGDELTLTRHELSGLEDRLEVVGRAGGKTKASDDDLKLPAEVTKAMDALNLDTPEELADVSDKTLLEIEGIGAASVKAIRKFLG